jgi:Domain of unknown function (DUF4329)
MGSKAGTIFDDADATAIAAIEEINSTSITRNVEFAGRIVRSVAGFTFTKAQTLNQRDDSDPGPKIPGSIGTYHTHAGEFEPTDEEFSPDDMVKATLGKEVSYLGTPRGRILKFPPVDLLSEFDQRFNPTGVVETLKAPLYNSAFERGKLLGRWRVDRPKTHDAWDVIFFTESDAVWTQGTGQEKFWSKGGGMWWIAGDDVIIRWRADLEESWPLPLRTQKQVSLERPGNRLIAQKIEGPESNQRSKFSIAA